MKTKKLADQQVRNYAFILNELKNKIRQARSRAAISVNRELLQTYWEIGRVILDQQEQKGWGSKVIDELSKDLKLEFPDFQGLSIRNLKYMRAFAGAYPDFPNAKAFPSIVQAPLAQLSWFHHITLLDKVKDPQARLFYILKTIENGWSKNAMVLQIERNLNVRQGALTTNFTKTIVPEQSELLQQVFKDPYILDFVQLTEKARERDIENALLQHLTRFLLELGDGFAFLGRQKALRAGEKEFFIDLLFYHTILRRYILIELKIGEFEAEFAGKMNLYLGVADDTLKGPLDESSIGLILCKTKDKIVAEYALRDTSKPIGIAEYKIAQALPENIKGELPSIEELEQKLVKELNENANPIDERLKAIKEKLKTVPGEEIQTPVTYTILVDLFLKALKPLYAKLIEKLAGFNELFHNHEIVWHRDNKKVENINELVEIWKDETVLPGRNLFFEYSLSGFKKAGTENYGVQMRLQLELETYWYGFTLMRHNNDQPFLKKLYHQPLSDHDQSLIIDVLSKNLLDQIEWIVSRIVRE